MVGEIAPGSFAPAVPSPRRGWGRRPSAAGDERPGRPALSQESFADLVRPHLPAMLAAARAILDCEHHSCDAVQEALPSLWQEPKTPANLRAWLLRTVRYRSLHLLRTCTRRRKHEGRAATCQPEAHGKDDPARAATNDELAGLLDRALAALPVEQRHVFLMREVEQLDYEAIARALRVPVGTVRSRLSRSRRALRKLLKERVAAD